MMPPTAKQRLFRSLAAAALLLLPACGGQQGSDVTVTTATVPPSTTAATTPAASEPLVEIGLMDVSGLVRQVTPGVVSVTQERVRLDTFGVPQEVPAGSGTGVVIDSEGHVLTNFHVIEGASTVNITAADGAQREATVVAAASNRDLALLRLADPTGLQPLPLGDMSTVEVGDPVIAIGNALGLDATSPTVSTGIVSATGRSIRTPFGLMQDLIQTDAAINPGNSGGPLVNMQGEVVGINSSIRTTSSSAAEGGSIGLGFAIPLDKVRPIVDQLRANETPTHARLGVSVANAASRDDLMTGAGISSVNANSAAAAAGLERGDVVTRVDDQVIVDSESLVATIRGYRPGDRATLTVVRDGEERTIEVVLDSDRGSARS